MKLALLSVKENPSKMTIKIVQSKFLKDGMTVSFNTTTSQMGATLDGKPGPAQCTDCSSPLQLGVHWLFCSHRNFTSISPIDKIWREKNCKERQLETLETCVTQTDAQFFVNICKNNKRRFDLQIKIYLQKAKLLLINFLFWKF